MSTMLLAHLAGSRVVAAGTGNGAASSDRQRANGGTAQAAGMCATRVLPGASFKSIWYFHPERLMSQSERLPS
jgi:hypothetical protein